MIRISNCNNIDRGEISIKKNHLNIKYANNGTGKSSISSAICAKILNDESALNSLTPFKCIDSGVIKPEIDGLDEYKSVKIFNDEYVEQYVFQSDELIKDSFEIFVKTPDYDTHIKNIDLLIKDIHEVFKNDEDLNLLIYDLQEFLDSYGKTKTGYSKTSILGRGLGEGNKLTSIPEEIRQYTPFLIKSETNVQWLKWQIAGKEYQVENNICPYCANDITLQKDNIAKVSENFDSKEIDSLNKIIVVFQKFERYFSDDTNKKIKEISTNITGISKEQKEYLTEIRNQVKVLKDKLEGLNDICFISLNNPEKNVMELITGYKTNLSYIMHLNSEFVCDKIDKINSSIDEVLDKVGKLQGEINQQRHLIKNTIQKYNNEINSFLKTAGYKYYVNIDEENGNFKLKLYHNDYSKAVSGNEKHLSYGEKNAFSLALFMYSALNENPDLIVLDDPISSFDGNKKFAILNMLFMGSNSFKDKTVILLTHDFNIVIDTIYNFKSKILPTPIAHFLSTKEGILKETEIQKDDIKSFVEIAKSKFSSSINVINKLIYLRRLLELEGNKDLEWNLLSSIFHKYPVPTIQSASGTEEMSPLQIDEAERKIKGYIHDFDFDETMLKVNDTNFMKVLYSNCNCNYEKLQIFRIIFDEIPLEDVVKKYINETYHIENDYLFQLDPNKYDTIPNYIMCICDDLVTNFKKTRP